MLQLRLLKVVCVPASTREKHTPPLKVLCVPASTRENTHHLSLEENFNKLDCFFTAPAFLCNSYESYNDLICIPEVQKLRTELL